MSRHSLRRKGCLSLLLTATLLLGAAPALARDPPAGLSPPWWITYSMFAAALVPDACLTVGQLEPVPDQPAFAFNTTVCADAPADKLAGLATFLTARYDFGGTLFLSTVLDHRGRQASPVRVKDGEHALKLAGAALQGNPLFVATAVSSPLPCIDFYWAIFQPRIMQLWADNLADLWGNINLLAADLFARVFGLEEFGVRATTLKFNASADPSILLERGGSGPAASAALPREQQQDEAAQPAAEAVEVGGAGQRWEGSMPPAALRQRWRQQLLVAPVEAAACSGRRQLAAAVTSSDSSWRQGLQCWALRQARRLGGDAAVLKVQRWVL